ncbi:MAG: hypothetical protein AAB560_00455 [Patescibacteria group bacterium]
MEKSERGVFNFIYFIVLAAAVVFIAAGLPACGKGLPTGPSKTETISAGSDPDLRAVKKYNADHYRGHATRWNRSTIDVHDAVGVPNLQGILNDWNNALGGKLTLAVGGPGSPIQIVGDSTIAECGLANVPASDYRIENVKISIRCNTEAVVKHELGHAVGFAGHASDGGVMDVRHSLAITEMYAEMLRRLYDLAPGTVITD